MKKENIRNFIGKNKKKMIASISFFGDATTFRIYIPEGIITFDGLTIKKESYQKLHEYYGFITIGVS